MYEIRITKIKPSKKVSGVFEEQIGSIIRPVDVLPILEPIRDHKQEHFIAISLDGAGKVVNSRIITKRAQRKKDKEVL